MLNANLIVMRHAEARPAVAGQSDFSRALSESGAQEAHCMGRWLAEQLPPLKRVLASPAVRTRETVAAVLGTELVAAPEVRWDPQLYLADLPQLLDALGEELTRPLLLVGHNPGLEYLIGHLLDAEDAEQSGALFMPTAGVYALELPPRKGPPARGSATLVRFVCPERLTLDAPPTPGA